jgi:hypothetical protein
MFAAVLFVILLWWLWPRKKDSLSKESAHVPVPEPTEQAPTTDFSEAVSSVAEARTFGSIELCEMEGLPDTCMVCRSIRPQRFVTTRINLCQRCVNLLCSSSPIDIYAINEIILAADYCPGIDHGFMEQVLNDGRKNRVISERATAALLQSNEKGHSKDWLKFMRAYHLGLISGGERYVRPPDNEWGSLARDIRQKDGLKCKSRTCHSGTGPLHVHHIIPLSRYGTNDPRNLVTLCYSCHRDQHPTINFCLGVPDQDII